MMCAKSLGAVVQAALFVVVLSSSAQAQGAAPAAPLRPSVKPPTRTDATEGRALLDALDARLAASPKRKGVAPSTRSDTAVVRRTAAPDARKAATTAAPPPPAVRPAPKRGTPPLREGS